MAPQYLGAPFLGASVLLRCSRHVWVGLLPKSVNVDVPPDDADAPDKDAPDAKDALDNDDCTHACMSTGGPASAGCDQWL
jgi:hypothetical protein